MLNVLLHLSGAGDIGANIGGAFSQSVTTGGSYNVSDTTTHTLSGHTSLAIPSGQWGAIYAYQLVEKVTYGYKYIPGSEPGQPIPEMVTGVLGEYELLRNDVGYRKVLME